MTQIKFKELTPEIRLLRQIQERRLQSYYVARQLERESALRREKKNTVEEWILRLLKYMGCSNKQASVLLEVIKTAGVVAVIIFYIIFYIYFNKTYRSTHESNQPTVKTFPVMVWMNHLLAPARPTIYCSNGRRCDVYSMLTQPAGPVSAYLFDGFDLDYERFPLPRNSNTIWALTYHIAPLTSLELLDEKALELFNFSSTFSSQSDMPIPSWSITADSIKTLTYYRPVSQKSTHLPPVLYLRNGCDSLTEREEYVKQLQKYIKVEIVGYCFQGSGLVKDQIAQYKFLLVVEDAVCEELVSEALWVALEVGVVPIYFGSPSIRDWLPNSDSAILIEEYPTPKLLSDYLHVLLANDTEYEKHLEHKLLQLFSNYELFLHPGLTKMFAEGHYTTSRFECFVCDKLHDKETWNQKNVVSKSHVNCTVKSALTLKVDNGILEKVRQSVDVLYNKMLGEKGNGEPGDTNTSNQRTSF